MTFRSVVAIAMLATGYGFVAMYLQEEQGSTWGWWAIPLALGLTWLFVARRKSAAQNEPHRGE